jgi:YVTN family beta-propeller protein
VVGAGWSFRGRRERRERLPLDGDAVGLGAGDVGAARGADLVVPEAIQPVGLRVTSDGKLVFVALGPANRVAVVDGETGEVIKYLLVGQRVWQLAFTPDEKYLVTTNGNPTDISVVDVASLKVIKSIQVGLQPWASPSRRTEPPSDRRIPC